MRTLVYEAGKSPREWGRVHGETFKTEIAELAAIRTELIRTNWGHADTTEIVRLAAEHLEPLKAFDQDLYEETMGIAEASGCTPEQIVILNHYTDLRDLRPQHQLREDGCSSVWVRNDKGAFLGQTWDMHATAAPYVMMLRVPEPVDMWCLTITGCVALCGLSDRGVGVCINNLISLDATVGVIWPALVRKMLQQPSARQAWSTVKAAPVGSGHHYLLADAQEVFAVETSGVMRKTIFQGEEPVYYHTNHCLDEETAACHRVGATSTTFDRYRLMGEHLNGASDLDLEGVWEILGSKKEYPRSLFTNLATAENPHAMFTCARFAADLKGKKMLALPGLDGVGEGLTFEF